MKIPKAQFNYYKKLRNVRRSERRNRPAAKLVRSYQRTRKVCLPK